MGGGKGGGSAEIPGFVREGTQALGERSRQLFDISRPLLESSTGQILDLVRTGGPGANVPIIQQAVAAQRGATERTQAAIGGDLVRAGLEPRPGGAPGGTAQPTGPATTGPVTPAAFGAPSQFASRLRERLSRGGATAAGRIPVRAAAPLVTTAITSALSGGRLGAAGFQGGLQALGTGARVGAQARLQAAQARRQAGLQFGRNLVRLTEAGGFNFLRDPVNRFFSPRPIEGAFEGAGPVQGAFLGRSPSPSFSAGGQFF